MKYLEEARDLVKPERNTLEVSFADIDKFNQNLATTVVEEYYRQVQEECRAHIMRTESDNILYYLIFLNFVYPVVSLLISQLWCHSEVRLYYN